MARGLSNEEIALVLTISPATVRTHITAIFAQLGVKNRTEAAVLLLSRPLAAPAELTRFLARPAIAILPVSSSDAAEPAALATALTQELAALFSRWCYFPVIARSSALGARALGTSSKEIGETLGARFLVDPTLRATPAGWRLTVQVDDAADGHALWTERYDFDRDPFAILDDLCAEVVARAYPVMAAHVQSQGHELVGRRPEVQAWQMAHRALDLQSSRDHAGNASASELCTSALERDPTLVLAHFTQGLCAYDAILNQWEPAHAGRERLVASAEACIKFAPHAAEGYFLLARHHQTLGDHKSAIESLETAISKNPSFVAAHALLAQALGLCDRIDEALTRMQHAQRLGPRSYVAGLATLQFAAGHFDLATSNAERAIALAPRYPFARALAAASAFCGGHGDRAREHLRFLREAYPSFEPNGFLATFGADVPAVARLSRAIDELSRNAS